jgi:hypothetical protein
MHIIIAILLALSLTACGTTSQVHHQSATQADLSAYDVVVVDTFTNGTKGKLNLASFQKIETQFADVLAAQIKRFGVFSVVRVGSFPDDAAQKAIRISGSILDYDHGNKMARLLLGLGAGSAYFKADVHLSDYTTNAVLTDIHVTRNSWPLGGAVAASQTADTLLVDAATVIATNLARAKDPKVMQERDAKAFPRS